jgi:hypothetical protein
MVTTAGAVGNLEAADGRREEPLVVGDGDDIFCLQGRFGDCDVVLLRCVPLSKKPLSSSKHLISPRGQKFSGLRQSGNQVRPGGVSEVTPAVSEFAVSYHKLPLAIIPPQSSFYQINTIDNISYSRNLFTPMTNTNCHL